MKTSEAIQKVKDTEQRASNEIARAIAPVLSKIFEEEGVLLLDLSIAVFPMFALGVKEPVSFYTNVKARVNQEVGH